MKNSTREISRFKKIISLAVVIVMILALASLNTGGALADQNSNDDVDESILSFDQEDAAYEESAEIGTLQEVSGSPEEPRGDIATESEEAEGGIANAEENEDGERSSADSDIVAENGAESNEAEANETEVNEAIENETTGDDSAESEPVENETAGDESTESEPAENVSAGNEIADNEDDEADGESSEEPEEMAPPKPNSISGFFWVDGNGDLDTDWDGLYNGNEQPLPDYPVSLYHAGIFSYPVAETRTDAKGRYIFEDLEPGRYVLEIWSDNVGGIEYLAPVFITSDNNFAIDWSIPGIPAYTEAIELEDEQSVHDVNAGLRLPMGIRAYAPVNYDNTNGRIALENLDIAEVNDTYLIGGRTWVVVRTKDINNVRYVYLIMRGFTRGPNQGVTFGGSTDYATSALRTRLTNWIADKSNAPIIHSIAVKPFFNGAFSSSTATTEPAPLYPETPPVMAWPDTQDVLFAPSIKDMRDWMGISGNGIPSGHPLRYGVANPFPSRFWFRTPSEYYAAAMSGYIYSTANTIDHGLWITGTNVADVPGVWVNSGAVIRKVEVYHINTDGEFIGNTNPDIYDVPINSTFSNTTFTLTTSHIRTINGYAFIAWKVGPSGVVRTDSFPDPTLTSWEVIEGIPIYLIYDKTGADVKVTKMVDNENNKSKEFTFNVEFQDSSGYPLESGLEFNLVGGTISGSGAVAPAGGIYILDSNGALTFTMKHGQTITIKGIPLNSKVIISESPEYRYDASYSINGGVSYDGTSTMPISIGSDSVTVDFVNTRQTITPTGIASDPWVIVAFAMAATALIVTGPAAMRLIKRRSSAADGR